MPLSLSVKEVKRGMGTDGTELLVAPSPALPRRWCESRHTLHKCLVRLFLNRNTIDTEFFPRALVHSAGVCGREGVPCKTHHS